MARAQMEIIGLVIVIIMLTIGLLLVVKFVILKQPSNLKQRQSESQLAANFINTLLQSSTTCNNYPMRDLIQNCVAKNDIICHQGRDYTACEFADITIKSILTATLDAWKMSYNLSISNTKVWGFNPLSYLKGNCGGEKEHKFSPIQAGGKTIIVDLEICR